MLLCKHLLASCHALQMLEHVRAGEGACLGLRTVHQRKR